MRVAAIDKDDALRAKVIDQTSRGRRRETALSAFAQASADRRADSVTSVAGTMVFCEV